MNKKKFLFAAFAAVALQAGFVSCSSDDDENSSNSGQIDDTNVVKDDASAVALVNGLYGNLQRLSSSYTFIVESAGNKLISFEGEESEPGPVVSRFEQQADTWYQVKIFNYLFLTVTQANEAIVTLDNSLEKETITKAGYDAAVPVHVECDVVQHAVDQGGVVAVRGELEVVVNGFLVQRVLVAVVEDVV